MASRPSRSRWTGEKANVQIFDRCLSGKYCFRTRAEAIDGAERLMDLGKVNPGCHLKPYLHAQPEGCGYWHVGNEYIVFQPETTDA